MRTERRVAPMRFLLATSAILAACLGVAFAVRLAEGSNYAGFAAVLGGILFTLMPASVYEWLVHRYIYHRKRSGPLGQIYRIHHYGHHGRIFPTWRYTTNGPVRRHPVSEDDVTHLYPPGWRNWISKVAHFCFYMGIGLFFIWIPGWILTQSPLFMLSVVVTSIVISDLFVRVHDAIHYPGQYRLVEAQPWFAFIDRHHWIHHVDMDANVNFLLPLADWCYGTLRTSLTSQELARHGTLEQAKANPVGHSEPAAVFARELRGSRAAEALPGS